MTSVNETQMEKNCGCRWRLRLCKRMRNTWQTWVRSSYWGYKVNGKNWARAQVYRTTVGRKLTARTAEVISYFRDKPDASLGDTVTAASSCPTAAGQDENVHFQLTCLPPPWWGDIRQEALWFVIHHLIHQRVISNLTVLVSFFIFKARLDNPELWFWLNRADLFRK